jgi:hypothetical protein
MTFAAIAIGVGTAAAGYLGSQAASGAAQTQANAQNQATQAQEAMFNKQFAAGSAWRQAGRTALGQIGSLQPYFNSQFNASDLNSQLAPNYTFQLNQGLGAMKNAENLGGGVLSGDTLRSLNNYAQNYAGNAYQQAFNNYTANQQNIYNRLAGIAGLGQQSSTAAATGSPSFSQGIAGTIAGAGTALAGGQVGSANAITGALNNGMGWYMLNNLGGSPTGGALQSAWGNGGAL